jgi:calcineurin-like phosphoesterase family protein
MSNKNRKRIFFTSDLHIGHANVIKFSNRPFRDVEHMHQSLIKRFNAVLTDHTVLYVLGDVGICGSEMMADVIGQIKGTKVLILGNHDKKSNAMYNIGFDVVLNNAMMMIAGEIVTMSHCPLLGVYRENTEGMRNHDGTENWHGELRKKARPFTMKDNGQFHLHGHIHSPNGGKSQKILGRQFDVGVDANNYRPVSISEIESWIAKYKQEKKWKSKN